jgi:hypothetical protein
MKMKLTLTTIGRQFLERSARIKSAYDRFGLTKA